MAESIWNFFTNGESEELHYTAEFLGRWDESIEGLTESFSKKSWSEHSTFTQSDYDQNSELYQDFPIDYDQLPETKDLFDPEYGIDRFTKLKELILTHSKIFESDFDLICNDLQEVLKFLEKARKENLKWYLVIDVDY